MRTIKLIFIIPCILLVFSACQKDNYAAPNATIFGALTDGEIGGPLQLSQAGSGGNVRMIVNDPAKYPAPSTFDLQLKADGTYSNSLVFAENYKVFPLAQSGPWQYLPGDSVKINLPDKGNVELNFKVVPFFRIAASVTDSTFTYTITKATTTTVTNNLSSVLLLINNYPIVNESVSSNKVGSYYLNQVSIGVTPAILGVQQRTVFPFGLTHLPKGDYYFRVAALGSGSNGKYNYSPVIKATVH